MIHEIPLERRTLHGHFSRELEPILSIEPGESIAFACPNAGWELDPGRAVRAVRRGARRRPRADRAGRGARREGGRDARRARRRGQAGLLGRDVRTETKVDWLLELDVAVDQKGARVGLAPFLGVMGMPPRRARPALDRPSQALRREHRLQGARRRDDALPPDPGRRRALLGRRRSRRARPTARRRAQRSSARSSGRS